MSPEEFLVSDKSYLTIDDFSSSYEIIPFLLSNTRGIVDYAKRHDLDYLCVEISARSEPPELEALTKYAESKGYSCFFNLSNCLVFGSHIDRPILLMFLVKGLNRVPETLRLSGNRKVFIKNILIKKVFKKDSMSKLTNESDPWNNPWINILSAFTGIKRIYDFQNITKSTLSIFDYAIKRLIKSEREPKRSNTLKNAGLDTIAKIAREFSVSKSYVVQRQFLLIDTVPARHPVYLLRLINPFTEKYISYRTLLDLFEMPENVAVERKQLKKLTLITPNAVVDRVKDFFSALKRDEVEFTTLKQSKYSFLVTIDND